MQLYKFNKNLLSMFCINYLKQVNKNYLKLIFLKSNLTKKTKV